MSFSRRSFLALAATSAAFGGLQRAYAQAPEYRNEVTGYGPLKPDPAGIFDLPEGFSYRVVSRAGQPMDDGLLTPGRMDGMGCFPAGRDRVVLVRNHELRPSHPGQSAFGPGEALVSRLPADKVYDRTAAGVPMAGGTTSLVWDLKAQTLVAHHMSLAGTAVNCAGGITPRRTWLSCEEVELQKGPDAGKDHGWVFEVPADLRGLADPVPITGMGRYKHEATATDPRTGIVYLTEDAPDGFCLFYRYLPDDRDRLHKGGRLQAMGFRDRGDPRNWDTRWWKPGEKRKAVWIDLDGVDSPDNALRHRGHAKGAAWFARGEGIFFGDRELYFACTSGGPTRNGQIIRYRPANDEVALFIEPSDAAVMSMADNLAISPYGHLFVCEDKYAGKNGLKGVTPKGQTYTFGRNAVAPPNHKAPNAELAGVCFSPDGSTMFVNVYSPGVTLAITGPWRRFRA
ncbi:alkaline phosphatase PhoX [Phenylobacterium sp.]|jgi:secreted PhoX family phosphatase|uniref:alkaline phosphatase PhoX n=1 Tax=Phenylobacterium sp. TaxID=1871053 RepID=UPI002F939509